ncbi:MAG: hypothetical protein R3A45_00995 [Bdellovibrionota bacterium]
MHKDEVPWIEGWKETAIATGHGDAINIGQYTRASNPYAWSYRRLTMFLLGDKLLSGDTLFIDGCGRTDLPGGNEKALLYFYRYHQKSPRRYHDLPRA